MGVHCGLEGIDYDKWRAPINDFLACSSAVPSLNAMDVPYGAAYFAKMAYRLAGETPLRPWDKLLGEGLESCHFEFPGSTHAIHSRGDALCHIRNTGGAGPYGSRSLKVTAAGLGGRGRGLLLQADLLQRGRTSATPAMTLLRAPGVPRPDPAPQCAAPALRNLDAFVRLYAKNGATGEVFRGGKGPGGWAVA